MMRRGMAGTLEAGLHAYHARTDAGLLTSA